MSDTPAIPMHLATVDADQWPSVAALPTGRMLGLRARCAEAQFAGACARAELEVDPDSDPDLVVDQAELFDRIAVNGWIGLAEGYMAGEWRTQTPADLVRVIQRLIAVGYNPRTRLNGSARYSGGVVSPELVGKFAGDGMSAFAGHFATGVPTMERISVPSHSPRAGKGKEPKTYFVSETNFGAPLETEKLDLGDAQARSVNMLLDAAAVRPGSHLVELPSSGGAVAIGAAARRATVDSVVTDPGIVRSLRECLTLGGAEDAVHISVVDMLPGGVNRRKARYDAVVSAEHLETMPADVQARYFALIDGLLARSGRAACQTVVSTGKMTPPAESALESLRAYIWPGLNFQTVEQIRKTVDTRSGLRIIAETHAPAHLELSLNHQRTVFQSQLREAAADGFDAVYRRLWMWQLALREALAREGMLDLAQLTLTHRHRRGVR
ncbi:class I SAM-dependent methyltransferase [Corynebacterium sp. P3-F1]|uniref:class I SAM-dependent methyltransferase n=1 Tax=Corynebacterium sp. P3-F1 TaxID=3059080 RepID=UPI00265D3759|nr:class I SAM-dependent methyltransferase [Corynebacterium sp. P3-F1]WKK61521.1 class I SAM-dependent methyltransferase [Corynebacterium sp. P3-F1]